MLHPETLLSEVRVCSVVIPADTSALKLKSLLRYEAEQYQRSAIKDSALILFFAIPKKLVYQATLGKVKDIIDSFPARYENIVGSHILQTESVVSESEVVDLLRVEVAKLYPKLAGDVLDKFETVKEPPKPIYDLPTRVRTPIINLPEGLGDELPSYITGEFERINETSEGSSDVISVQVYLPASYLATYPQEKCDALFEKLANTYSNIDQVGLFVRDHPLTLEELQVEVSNLATDLLEIASDPTDTALSSSVH